MKSWLSSAEISAAEEAYVAAEMRRLDLICNRSHLEPNEYRRALSAAWLQSVDALEALTVLRNAEAAARLREAAQEREPA